MSILKDNPNLVFHRPKNRWKLWFLKIYPRKKILVEDRWWGFYVKKLLRRYYVISEISKTHNVKKTKINMLFHKHNFQEIERFYAEPTGIKNDIEGRSEVVERLIEKMKFGQTTILYKCLECKKIDKEEILGKILTKNENKNR